MPQRQLLFKIPFYSLVELWLVKREVSLFISKEDHNKYNDLSSKYPSHMLRVYFTLSNKEFHRALYYCAVFPFLSMKYS